MITEDYVSFEIAKLLKEKGIEDDCEYTGWIGESGNHYFPDDTYLDDDEIIAVQKDRKEFIPLISLQMAMKWLREEKKIGIEVNTNFDCAAGKWYYEYGFCVFQLSGTFEKLAECDYDGYKTYEEACEAAIKYCLENLI